MKKIMMFFMIVLLLSMSVSAINWPWQKQKIQTQDTDQIKTVFKEQTKTQNKNMVNVNDALKIANNNKYTLAYIDEFIGDNFCIKSEEREIFLAVSDKIEILSEKPDKCYNIKITEENANFLFENYKSNKYMSKNEVMKKIEVPMMLKLKIMKIGIKSIFE